MALRSLPLPRELLRARSQVRNPNFSSSRPLGALQQQRSYSDAPPPPPPPPTTNQTPQVGVNPKPLRSFLNAEEVAKFAAIAETWWDFEGPFKPLHLINPTRLSFIRSTLCRHFRSDPHCARPFEGLKIIDVGCGGGILSEPLARMGATVTGIDAVEKNIKIASVHAGLDHLTSSIDYSCTTAEQLVRENKKFDAVISLELLASQLEPLTEQQLVGICNLQQSSQQAEDALSQGMEALQQSLAETLASGSSGPGGSSGNVANYMGQMAMAMGKLGTLENFLCQADNLRQQTLQQMHRILTTRQAARALLAIHDYYSRLRALSSLWLARPRE